MTGKKMFQVKTKGPKKKASVAILQTNRRTNKNKKKKLQPKTIQKKLEIGKDTHHILIKGKIYHKEHTGMEVLTNITS